MRYQNIQTASASTKNNSMNNKKITPIDILNDYVNNDNSPHTETISK